MRLAAIFVAACIVLIAGSAGAVAYFAFGFNRSETAIVAVAVLTALALYNMVSARLGVRAVADNQLRDMARGHADMARKIAELDAGVAALQRRLDGMLDKARAATDPLAVELGQLAEMVAAHE